MLEARLQAESLAEEAGLVALADLGAAVSDWAQCRVVGGHMVDLHLVRAGISDHRGTREADLVAPASLLADADGPGNRLLNNLAYRQTTGSRLERPYANTTAAIDLVGPAPGSRVRHNHPAGRFRIDLFPGVQFTLMRPPMQIRLTTVGLRGDHIGEFTIAIPDVIGAIVLKARARRSKDQADLELLVHAADAQGARLTAVDQENLDARRSAQFLHEDWSHGRTQRTRLRLQRVVERPGPRPEFMNP